MFIYWTEVDDETGCFNFIKGSHKNNDNNNTKLALTGKKVKYFLLTLLDYIVLLKLRKILDFLLK